MIAFQHLDLRKLAGFFIVADLRMKTHLISRMSKETLLISRLSEDTTGFTLV